MIIEQKAYSVQCDRCGVFYHDFYTDGYMWEDDGKAINEAETEGGWIEDGDEHYCPKCNEYIQLMGAQKRYTK